MKPSSSPVFIRLDSGALIGFCMALMLVFLQEGFTYYLSFQTLALSFVVGLVFVSRPSLINTMHLFLVFLALSFFIGIAAAYSPMVISRNSPNILLTIMGILTYAFIIGCLPNLVPKRVGLILYAFRYASAATVLMLASLIVLTELSLLPFLSREALLIQNSTLVTNFADEDALMNELAYMAMSDLSPRMDLFYGEPSYLGIVLFSCVACFMLTSRLISDFNRSSDLSSQGSFSGGRHYRYVVVVGIISLLYLQSLSSIIYAVLILFFEFRTPIGKRFSFSKLLALFFFAAFIVFIFRDSFEYALYRITMQDSLSLAQRFGSLLDFGINDYLFGLKDELRIPNEGFHNGLFYIIAVFGLAGIWYVFFLLRTVNRLAKPIKMSAFLVLISLALIMQNGAVFSPNKVVLFALILLPLSCARAIYPRKKLNLYREVVK